MDKITVRIEWTNMPTRPWRVFILEDNDYWRDLSGRAYCFKTVQQAQKFLKRFTTISL